MLVHLGMSGSLSHRRAAADAGPFNPRHDHVQFDLDDGSLLVYNDPRRFGLMKLYPDADFESAIELKGLGPEPFDGFQPPNICGGDARTHRRDQKPADGSTSRSRASAISMPPRFFFARACAPPAVAAG